MFKFLRKYNKWILAVGGTLLMITFIAPQLIQQFGGGNPGQQIVATYDRGSISAMQIQRANMERQIAATMVPNIMQLLGVQSGEHWFLLAEMAQRSGFLASVEDGRDYLESIANLTARQQAAQFGMQPEEIRDLLLAAYDEQRRFLIRERGYTGQQIDLALSRLRSIDRLVGAIGGEPMGGGIALSGPEFAVVGRRLFEQARANIAIFDANSGITRDLPRADEARLQEIFERFQGERRESNEFGIGYYREPAFAVEWVMINRSRVSAALSLDPVDVQMFYMRNRERFPGEFAAERGAVEMEFRRERLDAIVDAGVRAIRSELLRATRALPTDGRFRTLPDDWRRTRPTMQALAEAANRAIAQQQGMGTIMAVETGITSDMVEVSRLDSLGTITNAQYPVGVRSLSFRELMLSVRELRPETTIPLQRGLPFGPLSDPSGNRSFVMVTEVRPEGPAPILDVVRDRVVADARRLIAYEDLTSESGMATIRSVLESEGSAGVAGLASSTINDVSVARNTLVSAEGTARLASIDTQAFRDAVLEHIRAWDPLRPASEIPLAERVLIVPIPSTLTVAAVEITQHFPATRERIRQSDATVSFAARDELYRSIARDPLSLESIAEILNFRVVRPAGSTPEDDDGLD